MSVFTPVSRDQLDAWLKPCKLGPVLELAGIAAGVQNTNYFVTTPRGRWVLTLFEHLTAGELRPYLGFMAHLAARGIPCPAPVADAGGEVLRPLNGKPAVLVSCLSGHDLAEPGELHCVALGDLLARLHLAGSDFSPRWPNPRGGAWRTATAARVVPYLDAADRSLLTAEVALHVQPETSLPRGLIHGDLFRDNALFEAERLTGVLDFYFAGEDALLFDLAVAANDWCLDAAGDLDPVRTRALLAAYGARRPLLAAEESAWNAMLRLAALRFWLSRLEDFHLPRPGNQVLVKDPMHFRCLLQRRIEHPAPWLS